MKEINHYIHKKATIKIISKSDQQSPIDYSVFHVSFI